MRLRKAQLSFLPFKQTETYSCTISHVWRFGRYCLLIGFTCAIEIAKSSSCSSQYEVGREPATLDNDKRLPPPAACGPGQVPRRRACR